MCLGCRIRVSVNQLRRNVKTLTGLDPRNLLARRSVFGFARSVNGVSKIDVVAVMMPSSSGTPAASTRIIRTSASGNGVSRSKFELSTVGTSSSGPTTSGRASSLLIGASICIASVPLSITARISRGSRSLPYLWLVSSGTCTNSPAVTVVR